MDAHSRIPEGASELDGLEEHRLRLLGGQLAAHHVAETHGSEPGDGNLDVGKGKRLDHPNVVVLRDGFGDGNRSCNEI